MKWTNIVGESKVLVAGKAQRTFGERVRVDGKGIEGRGDLFKYLEVKINPDGGIREEVIDGLLKGRKAWRFLGCL